MKLELTAKKPIHLNPAHKGMLHEDLGVKQGEPIPAKKLEAATHSTDPAVKKRAVFAENAKSFHHGGATKKVMTVKGRRGTPVYMV